MRLGAWVAGLGWSSCVTLSSQPPPLFSRHQTFLQLLNTLQGKLLFSEAELEPPRELDLPEDKPQQLTQPQEQNTGDTRARDRVVSFKVNERWDRWAGR